MIDPAQLEQLLAQVEPWLALLGAQEELDPDLREAFYVEFRNATQDYAHAASKAHLRGLSNICMLLLRGLDDRKQKSLSSDDVMQLTLWLSGVQAYLEHQLSDVSCVITDVVALTWVPKLSPAAQQVLLQRLLEPAVELEAAALIRDAETAEKQREAEQAAEQLVVAQTTEALPESRGGVPETDESAFEAQILSDAASADDFSAFSWSDIGIDAEINAAEPIAQASASSEASSGLAEAEEAFAFDFSPEVPSLASEATEQALAETETALLASGSEGAAEGDGLIWIAPEEFQLVTETVQARLLPELTALANSEPEHVTANYVETLYQIELLGNAFAVLNLERSQAMCQKLVQSLPSAEVVNADLVAEYTPALMQWVVSLVDFCTHPDELAIKNEVIELVSSTDWIAPLDARESAQLAEEFARIQVGMDPSLKAARKAVILPEDANLSPAEDVMPQVLQGMLLELPDNAHALSEHIQTFIAGDVEGLDGARRVAHTLKGDSNTVGIRGIANLTHALEDIFIELAKNPGVPKKGFAALLTQAADCVSEMADHVLGRGEAPHDALEIMQQVQNIANELIDGTASIETDIDAEVDFGRAAPPDLAEQEGGTHGAELAARLAEVAAAVPTAVAAPAATTALDVPMLQVPADVMDRLLEFSSEALVLLRQIENQIKSVDEGQNEIERQRHEGAALLEELDKSVSLRGSALQSSRGRGEAVDPLELDQYNELYTVTRRLMEVSADEQTARNTIDRAARRLVDLAAEQEKVQLELQQQIMKTRQVAVKEFVGRFQRAVRQTAKMLDKDVNFQVSGQDTQIDRAQMESLIDPLMHALRNSVDHGIETQSLRMTRQKSVAGNVKLSFERDGRQISVKLSDDGAGLNYERIRAKAISRGFMSESDQVNEDDLAQIILLPGFSTKEEVTQVSGRGIGLDVVFQRIQDLRGTLSIQSKQGSGTTMDIRLPASMTSLYTALAPMSNGWAAIASDSVESFELIDPADCEIKGDTVIVHWQEQQVPVINLEALILGLRAQVGLPEQVGVGILVRASNGDPQFGYVKNIAEMRTVIVKDFGPYMRAFPGVRGGTILGDGSVAPVVDARELMRNTSYQPWSARDETYRETLSKQIKLRALIADDSLSVRRALEQLLTDAGFEVMAARDGLEALALIKQREPDIMLLDLEMPRMNGLEVSNFVRKSANLSDVPIIMITSRTSEKHAQMAQEAGITHLLAKPYAEDVLIALIQKYVGFKNSAIAA